MLKDLSQFDNVADYIPILNGAIAADLIIILMVFFGFFKTKFLKEWYLKLNFFAVLADVLILVIGFIITRFLYYKIFKDYSLVKFSLLFLLVQIIHDILFYIFFMNVPKKSSVVFDLFKNYANEVGGGAILGDSFMIVLTILFAGIFGNLNLNYNIIAMIVMLYIFPYIMYF